MTAMSTTAAQDGLVVAAGYGLKLYVERGHLIVHDGVGRNRQTRRYHRATSKLKRVVVIGHDGNSPAALLAKATDFNRGSSPR